jgi:sugar lactone lactonase YvrE
LNKLQIRTSHPKAIWKAKTVLGEGTLWVPSQNSIFFVDIKKKKILKYNIKTKVKKIINVDKEIGFLAHIKKNVFVLGLKSELRIVNLTNKKVLYSIKIESKKQNNRLNDGKTDSVGRLWFGTMDNLERKIKSGSLYCLDKNLKVHKIDDKYFITNGPAFLDKKNFYHTDTRKGEIYKIKINKKLKIVKKTKFLKFDKKDGSPDGMTTDIKNNLWVCHYGGACISVYNLRAKKIHKINLPAKNITNCTFAGHKNNELYISTARKGLKSHDLKKYPLSGSLFKVKTNLKGKKSISFKALHSAF